MESTALNTTLHGLAPAKLNLFLHVTGRRPDGYHLLQTAFRLIDWADELTFTLREDGQIVRTTSLSGVRAEDDLTVRAARLLQQETGCRLGVELAVTKHLPMGGGLGGGSSDAATTLMALNRLWGTGLTREELARLGLRLGADVPFFLFGRDAFAEGVGECLAALELPPAIYVILVPSVAVPTRDIFAAKELTRDCEPIKIADFASAATRNVLQDVACARFPEVADAIDWLGQHAPARMTGSGACVFAPVASETVAAHIARACPARWRVRIARSIERHPLADWLA
ncbi:MAG: 4-(cytidine 5'-diphospho)-2-C-methyl-D-erythritol kinase [Rhodocyclaceae bacterium]|jgi:4-diphosphocytidyl-2-C-methyl-D-erythritol kinase|nr:4-(cytidine 5'-diphospho)-2-C-methyl-D-erythritol kinase [Rhodocyclaceae bacterium]